MSDNQKKNQENDDYNKQMLKQTALTFTREGISNDLKYFIQKKITHNKTSLTYLTQLMDITVNSSSDDIIKLTFNKNSPLCHLIEHTCTEIIKTDALLDKAIKFVLEKDQTLKSIKE